LFAWRKLHIDSLTTGAVPDRLKIGKVVPVFKKGDRSFPSNYRLIALLFDKLLERLIYNRLHFLTENNILYEYQFLFREKSFYNLGYS